MAVMTMKRGWTFCGIQLMAGFAILLINDARGSTRTLVAYRTDRPVRIRELMS